MNALESTAKVFIGGTERTATPADTLTRVEPLLQRMGITRVANITGLDRIGVPVVVVCRPNARSLSTAHGKGASLLEARVSGVMEAIETYHAEHVALPLLLGSHDELRARERVLDLRGAPRLSIGTFHDEQRLLWVHGIDLCEGARTLVPYELVHLDLRLPLPTGSGAFMMSSNGLASGNHLTEALSHAICELIERDAKTLWDLSGVAAQEARKLDLDTVDDELCRRALGALSAAEMAVAAWETTSDIGAPSFVCSIVDADPGALRAMMPASGAGCHPRRAIALLRALNEAAQSRLTVISGAREDLDPRVFDQHDARSSGAYVRQQAAVRGSRDYRAITDVVHDAVEADVQWLLGQLRRAGLGQVVAINLTKPELELPVVRVVIPYLEAMSDVRGYVPGPRARQVIAGVAACG
jgi:ribosomal protein S12 methylthiotransferase accessory factor